LKDSPKVDSEEYAPHLAMVRNAANAIASNLHLVLQKMEIAAVEAHETWVKDMDKDKADNWMDELDAEEKKKAMHERKCRVVVTKLKGKTKNLMYSSLESRVSKLKSACSKFSLEDSLNFSDINF
jgi:hypothetical protein